MIHQILSYIKYYTRAKTVYNIHSPFVYDFILNVLDTSKEYYCYNELEDLRFTLTSENKIISFEDYGAGNKSGSRSISEIAKKSLSSKRQSRLLFNLICLFKPKSILEFGTSLGLSTLYMSYASKDGKIYTMEGNPDSFNFATELFAKQKVNNIRVYKGNFDEILTDVLEDVKKLDLVFVDGNHRGNSTLSYFHQIKPFLGQDSIVVFDDIYWSSDMTKAWKSIIKDETVTLSLDLFDLGIVFFNKKLNKEHHVLIDYWKKPWKLGIFG